MELSADERMLRQAQHYINLTTIENLVRTRGLEPPPLAGHAP